MKQTTLTRWEIKDTGVKKIREAHFPEKISKIITPDSGNLLSLLAGDDEYN